MLSVGEELEAKLDSTCLVPRLKPEGRSAAALRLALQRAKRGWLRSLSAPIGRLERRMEHPAAARDAGLHRVAGIFGQKVYGAPQKTERPEKKSELGRGNVGSTGGIARLTTSRRSPSLLR